jgi:ubiquinone/menaquinone biosynthesis C-methylase UbiE
MAYDRRIVEIRRALLRRFVAGRDVLDLCCGSGAYLIPILDNVKSAVGVDFSSNMLDGFRARLNGRNNRNLVLIEADAASLPLSDSCVDVVFSFTSLYYLPRVDLAIAEVARVLRPGGYAILELGNLYNINTLIAAGFHEELGWAKNYHISYVKMRRYLRDAGLKTLEWRCFQLSPMYGVPKKYFWLYPVAHPAWKKLMGIEIAGKMIDEWISSAIPLRYFASRHLIVIQKIC